MNCIHKAVAVGTAFCVLCGAALSSGHDDHHTHREPIDARLNVVELYAPSTSSFATGSGSFALWTGSTAT